MILSDFFRGVNKRAVPPPATSESSFALVPKPSSGAGMDDETEKLLNELWSAARTAGLEPGDPMMPLVTAFARSIRFMAERSSTSDRVMAAGSERIRAALVEARHTADAEAERFSAAVLATEADIIRRIAGSIAASANKALTRRIKVFDRNAVLLAAGFLFGVAASCLGVGYWWGHNNATASIHETEAGLRAAFSRDAANAQTWLDLMTWNNIAHAKAQCDRPAEIRHFQEGRRVCDVPFWIEPPLEVIATPLPSDIPTLPETPQPLPSLPQTPPEPFNPFGILPKPPHGTLHFGPEGSQ